MFAGIAAGDMNAIEPFDQTLHIKDGLKDAFSNLVEWKVRRRDGRGGCRVPLERRKSMEHVGWIRFFIVVDLMSFYREDWGRRYG